VPFVSRFPRTSDACFAASERYTPTRRTRTCATSLIPSGRHGSTRCRCRGFDVFAGFAFVTGFGAAAGTTLPAFLGTADFVTCFCTVAGADLSAAG
jgi:hypothetical protein